jgi:DNA modification methylase
MTFDLLPAADLLPYANNARRHPSQQIDQIVALIEEFGMVGGIVVRHRTIAKGHGTFAAIKRIYADGRAIYPAPGQRAGAKPYPKGMIPVIDATGWNEQQFKAYVIADNQSALNAGWDDELLRIEIGGLEIGGFNVDMLGFDDKELSRIFTVTDDAKHERANQVPATPRRVVSKLGDVWQLGRHRVMCGDSTNPEQVAQLLDGKKAQLLHADPPYGMGKDTVENDNLYRAKLDAFQVKWWQAARPHLADNASVYIWGNAPDLWRLWYAAPVEVYGGGQFLGLSASERLEYCNEIVWDKKTIPGMKSDAMTQYAVASERCLFFHVGAQYVGNVNSWDFPPECEAILTYMQEQATATKLQARDVRRICECHMYSHWFTRSQFHLIGREYYEQLAAAYPGHFLKPWRELKDEWENAKAVRSDRRSYFDNGHTIMRDVWEADRVSGEERYGHDTPKPVILMERVMKSSLPKGGICYEPFGGTGSTLIGAETTDRTCYVMELTAGFVDVIVTRWQNFTGGKAKLVSSGASFDQLSAERAA